MFKEISIGSRKVPMLANGATPLYYKQVFQKDLISNVYNAEDRVGEVNDAAPELAFIMAKQAEKANNPELSMSTLNYDSFIEWLEGFEATSILFSTDDIMDLYFNDSKLSSKGKKKTEKQKDL